MYEDFGKWLRTARKRRRLTQKQLAALTGYSDGYISIIENAAPHSETGVSVRPSEDFIEKVSSALRVKEEDGRVLAGYHANPEPVTLRELRDETPSHIPALDFAQGIELNLTTGEKHYLTPEEIVKLFARLEQGMEVLKDSMLRYAEKTQDSIEK